MNDSMQAGMAEATRLMRAGRLAEATAMIQRTLGRVPAPNVSVVDANSAGAPIASALPVRDDSSPATEPSGEGMARNRRIGGDALAARLAAAVSALSPEARRFPGSMPRTTVPLRPVTPEVIPPSPQAGGQFVDGTYSNTAGTRAYKVYIPSGYTGQAVPLVVMLHGCTQRPVDFAADTHMNVLAEGETFLVAYPEQAPSANGSKCWNWFQESDQQRDGGEPSLIAGITRQIMSQYQVDVSRVYVAGMSAGGAMAVIMAAMYPDLYAAAGVQSGFGSRVAHHLPPAFAAMQQGTVYHARPLQEIIPLITFHGDGDTTVAPVNADCLLDQWLQAACAGLGSVPGMKVERGQVANGHAYTRCIYNDDSGRALMEQGPIPQAGHGWSGGSLSGFYTDPQGPNASTEMVRFFTEHPSSR